MAQKEEVPLEIDLAGGSQPEAGLLDESMSPIQKPHEPTLPSSVLPKPVAKPISAKQMLAMIVLLLNVFSTTTVLSAQASDTLSADINATLAQHNIARLGAGQQLGDPQEASSNSFTYSSTLIRPPGDAYVIITDQTDPGCAAALEKLATVHHGRIIHCDDFRSLPTNINIRAGIVRELREAKPKYIAIAPRLESYTENVVLSFWQMLCNVGGGQITVFPAFLVARNADGLQHLIDQSLIADKEPDKEPNLIDVLKKAEQTDTKTLFSAVTIAQSTSQSAGGARAVQKAAFVEDLFKQLKVPCDTMIVRTKNAPPDRYPELASLGCFDVEKDGLVHELAPAPKQAVTNARLLSLFGHGSPGMTCSLQVGAFRQIPFENKIVLCGSCFSCYPPYSDLPGVPRVDRECFFGRAIQNGARVFYGHMRFNVGFPVMFVAMESLLQGESVGQSYQRVLNVVVAHSQVSTRDLIFNPEQLKDQKAISDRNNFLVIMIGDPAARPFPTNSF